jgi:hypothetical protein
VVVLLAGDPVMAATKDGTGTKVLDRIAALQALVAELVR